MSSKSPSIKQKEKTKGSTPIVDSLATALNLLDHFSIREPELSLRDLSEKTGLYKSRIHRLCATLVAFRFLTRLPSASYRLGPKLLTLGKIYEKSNNLLSIARPIMKELAEISGESVALFHLDGDECFCLAREYGSSRLVFDIQEGTKMELHASAAGRIFLTYGPRELAVQILARPQLTGYTSATITNHDVLAQRLIDIKARGYEINHGERELEVATIAVPIWNLEHQIEATLTIAGPVQRFSGDHEAMLIELLQKASWQVSEMLGANQ